MRGSTYSSAAAPSAWAFRRAGARPCGKSGQLAACAAQLEFGTSALYEIALLAQSSSDS